VSPRCDPDPLTLLASWAGIRYRPMRHPVTLACLALGVILRTIQFAAQNSLWLDELAIAHTVVVRDVVRLVTEPMAYRQVAPAGFLALTKGATAVAGAGELGFRLVPWLASIAALFVLWAVAQRLLARTAAWTVLALFAASPALTWFGSQAKQYSTDVLAVLLLIWAGCELLSPRPRIARAVAAGTFALLVSMPAVLTGWAIGMVLLVAFLRTGIPARGPFVLAGGCWTVAALITAGLAQLTLLADTREYMLMFWARGFPPSPTSLDALAWTPRTLHDSLRFALFFRAGDENAFVRVIEVALTLLILPGGWWLARRSLWQGAVVISPIAAGLIASMLRLLPLDGRVSLWLVGPLLLLSGAGLSALAEWLPRFRALPATAGLLFASTGIAVGTLIDPPPHFSQHLKPVLQRAAAQMQPGDAVYVYYGARLGMRFYGPGAGITQWTEGNCHRRRTPDYFRELDAFRGRGRVWVIWTHAIPRFGEPEAIRSYLSTIGTERLRIDAKGEVGEVGAGQVLLYDLSDPVRLSASTADRHPIPPPDHPDGGPDVPCGGPANDASVVR
jgi:hypothetical protein